MPWNEPGGTSGNNKNNDPWNGKGKEGPPDLDKVISDFIKKLRQTFTFKGKQNGTRNWGSFSAPSKDHHYGIGITLGVMLIIWALSGLFIVNPAEQAVVLRFGKFADVLQPGLHWMARFIDTKYLVDVRKIYSFSLSGDFLTKSSDQSDMPNQYIPASKTGSYDQSKNLVNVELNVQYRISDPRAYLFNIVNPDETVQQVSGGALSDVIGKMKLDEVLTTGRELLSTSVLTRTRTLMNAYDSGIEVVTINLRKVQAPDQVRVAFSDVNRADQDRATYIQQAQAYASKVLPHAQGVAARTIADANAYQQQIVLRAQASVAKYQALLKAYTISPEVTRQRMYLEAIQNIFTHTTKILVDFNTSQNMFYLPLDKLLKPNELSPQELKNDMRMDIPQLTQSTAGLNANLQNGMEVKNVSN